LQGYGGRNLRVGLVLIGLPFSTFSWIDLVDIWTRGLRLGSRLALLGLLLLLLYFPDDLGIPGFVRV